MTDHNDLNSIQTDLAPLAFQKYAAGNNVASCVGSSIHAVSYNVTTACKQVHSSRAIWFTPKPYISLLRQILTLGESLRLLAVNERRAAVSPASRRQRESRRCASARSITSEC